MRTASIVWTVGAFAVAMFNCGSERSPDSRATGGASEVNGGMPALGGAGDAAGAVSKGGSANQGGSASGDGGDSGGAGGSAPRRSQGVVQKGPFILGTTITLQELDSQLSSTGRQFVFQTDDDLGHFQVPTNVTSRFVEIIARGYFFDELTNELSHSELTWGAVERIREIPLGGRSVSPALALDNRGRATVLWVEGTASEAQLLWTRFEYP
jgi:hypothetical protein